MPGGESTTIDKLLRAFDLRDLLMERIQAGLPVLGSCAGMILLATDLVDGIEGQQTLEAIPMTVRRNAFGRQVDSAEASLTWLPDGSSMRATFIRAPWVESYADEVEVLATAVAGDGVEHAVAVQYGSRLATAFHPEISDEAPRTPAPARPDLTWEQPTRAEPSDDVWEVRVEAFWDGVQRDDVAGVIAGAHALAEARPAGDAAALYEVASAHDYVGREAEAVVLYERALAAGLGGRRADEAVIQAREFAAERGASGRCGGVARVDVRQRGACTRRGGLPCPRAA
ncbi:pyridoxal 5'-phosphate synthase glutaminase subunit PdxT [Demequina litorisediminis]|uniref:Tetratrico peptide repeat group 5 domain-containing protein n=1 Tax=Demequina litorisediminis TaxID=1849022 RepID=A0ABQ6I7U8_9MICO|nr:hypothetical protein GCM10025876_00690 [Demequina litorisediminis]